MDKKTYEALRVVMTWARQRGADEAIEADFTQVLDWMREVQKDYVGVCEVCDLQISPECAKHA